MGNNGRQRAIRAAPQVASEALRLTTGKLKERLKALIAREVPLDPLGAQAVMRKLQSTFGDICVVWKQRPSLLLNLSCEPMRKLPCRRRVFS